MKPTTSEKKVYATQVFYTKKFALQIQISSNGIFFEIAPALANSDKYNWEAKKGTKFSVSEVCNLMYALETLRINGAEAYTDFARSLFGDKYKNVQFVHVNRKNEQVRTGFNLYNGNLSFIIFNQDAKVNMSCSILPVEKMRLEKFLNFVVSIAFSKGI